MAIQIVSKKGHSGGSTPPNRVVLHITGGASNYSQSAFDSDLNFQIGGARVSFRPTKIETVIVANVNGTGGGDRVIINGTHFSEGNWDYSEVGGLPLGSVVTATNIIEVSHATPGTTPDFNVVIVLRA